MKIKSIEMIELNNKNKREASSKFVANNYLLVKDGTCVKTIARNKVKPPKRGKWLIITKTVCGQWIFDKGGW
jgi:hypothetical protein